MKEWITILPCLIAIIWFAICVLIYIIGIIYSFFNKSKSSEKEIHPFVTILTSVEKIVKQKYKQIYSSEFFIASEITPDAYLPAFIFKKDKDLEEAKKNGLTNEINNFFKQQLLKMEYPKDAIKDCIFASQEDCNKRNKGNWYYYFH